MPEKLTIRMWLWSQHCPPEVMADFEKLFALPEKWRSDVIGGVGGDLYRCAEDLESLLGKP